MRVLHRYLFPLLALIPAHGATSAPAADTGFQEALAAGRCEACHAPEQRLVGPSYKEIADKYGSNPDAVTLLTQRVRDGSSGVWGPVPMMPFSNDMISDAQLRMVLQGMLSLGKPPSQSTEPSASATQLPAPPPDEPQPTASTPRAPVPTATQPGGAHSLPAIPSLQTMNTVLAGTPTHRPLRSNPVPPATQNSMDPEVFTGYPGAAPYRVVAREQELSFYPCAQCHQHMTPNPTPRKLVAAPHPAALDHGEGRMWCLDCHSPGDRNNLRTIQDEPVGFNDSDRLCGQCHAQRQKDWAFGSHGKRVAGWGEDRAIYACTHCHDPHSPSVKPRAPSATPPVRAGLKPMPSKLDLDHSKLWQVDAHDTLNADPGEEQGGEQ